MTTHTTITTLSVVVLSYQAPASLPSAVRSLQAQQPGCEIVVVNSGGGGTQRLLELAGVECRIIEHREQLNPGAVRNIGIKNTSGDIVAFLADDCRATDGWIAARLAKHAAGHRVVASALLPDRPERLVSLASHVMLFGHRMPGCTAKDALLYGASYHRSIFETYGVFREDLRTGEDTDFHERFIEGDRPVWAPEVQTIHKGPSTVAEFFKDQAARGRRTSAAWSQLTGSTPVQVMRNVMKRTGRILRLAPLVVPQRTFPLALPCLVIAGNIAYAWGAVRYRPTLV